MTSEGILLKPEADGHQFTATGKLLIALAPYAVIVGAFFTLKGDVKDAIREAASAQTKADSADRKADAAITLTREKGEKTTDTLNTMQVTLAEVKTMVLQLVKDSDENKAAVKELREGAPK